MSDWALLISWPLRWLHQLDTVVRVLSTWTSCRSGYKCTSACFHLVADTFAVCCHRVSILDLMWSCMTFMICLCYFATEISQADEIITQKCCSRKTKTEQCGHNYHHQHLRNLFWRTEAGLEWFLWATKTLCHWMYFSCSKQISYSPEHWNITLHLQ